MKPTGHPRNQEIDVSVSGWFVALLVAVPTLLIIFIMAGVVGSGEGASLLNYPTLLVANTPTGGDIGAHVLLPQILRDALLPSWTLSGWSNTWFAGFPVLYFYFPLPALATVLLGVFIPSGVAFKIVISAGLIALPAATYFLLRWLSSERLIAAVAASAAAAFVFMESYDIFGGNIKSTLAGEFSFSWSLTLVVLYLGLVARDVNAGGRLTPWPGIALSLVTLSHVVSTIIVVVVTVPWLFRRLSAQTVVTSWVLGFGISAFWSIPFAVRVIQGMTTDMRWAPVTGLVGAESPMPLEIVPALLLGAAGLVWSVIRRKRVSLLFGLMVVPLAGYFVLPRIGVSAVNNGRLLPFWYLGVFMFAGIALGVGAVQLGRMRSGNRDASAFYALVVVLLVVFSTLASVSDVPHWVNWDFSGYEGKSDYGEYDALMSSVDALPPGRVMWEEHEDIHRYGTELALMLFPFWSEGHPSMAGLYQESSLTTPFNVLVANEVSLEASERIPGLVYHPMDFDRGIAHLALYDVAYYVGYTQEAITAALEAGLEPVAVVDPWVVFALPPSDAVDVAQYEPSVWVGGGDFTTASLAWYSDIDHLDRWLVADGPEEWRRVEAVDERLSVPVFSSSRGPDAVSNIAIEDNRISFETTAIGVPHLVKVSYFPNWHVEGATGPYRAAPSLMVVVPTSESVVLEFSKTWVERLGTLITVATLTALAGWAWLQRRKRRALEATL